MRPIDADALEEILKDFESRYKKAAFCLSAKTVANVRQIVYAMKTVDAVEVVHGRWETHNQIDSVFYCSVCKLNVSGFERRWLNYCPNCGADMRGGNDA